MNTWAAISDKYNHSLSFNFHGLYLWYHADGRGNTPGFENDED